MFSEKKLIRVRNVKYFADYVSHKIQDVAFLSEHGMLTNRVAPIFPMMPDKIKMSDACNRASNQEINIFHRLILAVRRKRQYKSTSILSTECQLYWPGDRARTCYTRLWRPVLYRPHYTLVSDFCSRNSRCRIGLFQAKRAITV